MSILLKEVGILLGKNGNHKLKLCLLTKQDKAFTIYLTICKRLHTQSGERVKRGMSSEERQRIQNTAHHRAGAQKISQLLSDAFARADICHTVSVFTDFF